MPEILSLIPAQITALQPLLEILQELATGILMASYAAISLAGLLLLLFLWVIKKYILLLLLILPELEALPA